MELSETVGLMCSEDFRDRLKAEYIQLRIRMQSLERYLSDLEKKTTKEGQHMRAQLNSMVYYRNALRDRMVDLGVEVDLIDDLFNVK